MAANNNTGKTIRQTAIYVFLILGSIIALFPFYWMVSSSFKISWQISKYPPVFFPTELTFEHYKYVWETMDLIRVFMNSIIVSFSTVILNLFLSGMVSYALVKLKFPGRNALFITVIAFMMVPFQLLMVPLFLMINKLGMIGTYGAMIFPSCISSFSIFLLRQAMIGVPNDYIDSAKIDGCNHFTIYFKVVMPLIVPMAVTVALTNFFWSWNSYMWPMLVTVQHDAMATMQVAIARYRTLQDMKWGATMAGCTLTAVPIVIVYIFLQKQFIESLAMSGIKG